MPVSSKFKTMNQIQRIVRFQLSVSVEYLGLCIDAPRSRNCVCWTRVSGPWDMRWLLRSRPLPALTGRPSRRGVCSRVPRGAVRVSQGGIRALEKNRPVTRGTNTDEHRQVETARTRFNTHIHVFGDAQPFSSAARSPLQAPTPPLAAPTARPAPRLSFSHITSHRHLGTPSVASGDIPRLPCVVPSSHALTSSTHCHTYVTPHLLHLATAVAERRFESLPRNALTLHTRRRRRRRRHRCAAQPP